MGVGARIVAGFGGFGTIELGDDARCERLAQLDAHWSKESIWKIEPWVNTRCS